MLTRVSARISLNIYRREKYSYVQQQLYIEVKGTLGRAVAQAVRRWLPTAAARVRVRAACGVCSGQSGTGTGFLRVLQFPLPIIPPISPSSYSPGAGTIGHWWTLCRVDPIGLHPPLYQFKKKVHVPVRTFSPQVFQFLR
jgi:hypothetical protein